jgi:hypothetical protein
MLIKSFCDAMGATCKDSPDARILRKRLAARLRQQRCRARKRAALVAQKRSQVEKDDYVKSKPMPFTVSARGGSQAMSSPPRHVIPNYTQGQPVPRYDYPAHPMHHHGAMGYCPPPPHPPHPHGRVHVTISYEGRPHHGYMMPPRPHSHLIPQNHLPMRPASRPPTSVSTHYHHHMARTVSEEEKSQCSPPSTKSVTFSPIYSDNGRKKETPLVNKERAAIEAMLSLGSASDESSDDATVEDHQLVRVSCRPYSNAWVEPTSLPRIANF